MKLTFKILCLLFVFNCYSQKNMDTIYGNPKSVREKVEFLNEEKQNYKFLRQDGDYGHAMIFTPRAVKSQFNLYWYNYHWVFYINYYKEFELNGNTKTETWFNKNDSFKRKYKYTYDENKNLVEEKEIYSDSTYYIIKYALGYKGKVMSTVSMSSDESDFFSYSTIKYDSIGNRIKTSRFDEEGYSETTYYKYNKENKLSSIFCHTPNKWRENSNGSRSFIKDSVGTWRKIKKYEYDINGNIILESGFNENNKISKKTIYKYDNQNNQTYIGYARDTIYAYRKYTYDLNNNKTRYEYSVVNNNSTRELVKYKYNKKGYIINVFCHFRNKDYNIDFKYKFDKKGNWTKITKIVNGEPLYIWTRKIKYY